MTSGFLLNREWKEKLCLRSKGIEWRNWPVGLLDIPVQHLNSYGLQLLSCFFVWLCVYVLWKFHYYWFSVQSSLVTAEHGHRPCLLPSVSLEVGLSEPFALSNRGKVEIRRFPPVWIVIIWFELTRLGLPGGPWERVKVVKTPPDLGQEDSPGGRHGNLLQCSRLENPQGQRGLAGCSPQSHKESDRTEVT